MAAIQGMRGTGEFSSDFRPKNYRELFTLLEPNGNAPLNALLSMGSSESTDDPEYKNFRDELPERVLTTSAAVADTTTGTVPVSNGDDNKYAISGAILVNQTTGEVMHVTADYSATNVVVTRNIGGTSHQIASGAKLFVAGFAAAEGASSPTAITFDATVASNYTQIFRTAFQVTNTLGSTYLRTGDKMDEAMTKALKLHMSDIERAMFFGKKHEANGSTNAPTRYTGGLINSMTNVTDITTDYASYGGASAGNMTEEGFDDLLISSVFKFGSKQKIAFVGETVANHLQQIGKNRWRPTAIEGTYGVNLTQYETFAGDLMVHLHPQFRQLAHMKTSMVVVDFPYLSYRYLEGRDTQLLENRQSPDADTIKHEYLSECGLELLQDKVHSYIKNWSGRS
tara:strand:+ start:5263 stop:6453 length:1191 start_codon:yes stop_codon:yes gene_type:complete